MSCARKTFPAGMLEIIVRWKNFGQRCPEVVAGQFRTHYRGSAGLQPSDTLDPLRRLQPRKPGLNSGSLVVVSARLKCLRENRVAALRLATISHFTRRSRAGLTSSRRCAAGLTSFGQCFPTQSSIRSSHADSKAMPFHPPDFKLTHSLRCLPKAEAAQRVSYEKPVSANNRAFRIASV